MIRHLFGVSNRFLYTPRKDSDHLGGKFDRNFSNETPKKLDPVKKKKKKKDLTTMQPTMVSTSNQYEYLGA